MEPSHLTWGSWWSTRCVQRKEVLTIVTDGLVINLHSVAWDSVRFRMTKVLSLGLIAFDGLKQR
jgi:hypothetical protein